MGDSNGAWGELASHDTELAEAFDQYQTLPEPGENPALDAFLERKHIDVNALVKLGARIDPPDVLAFGFPGGIKYRNIVTDARWSYSGSSWRELKLVHASSGSAHTVIVAEGETDAARLLRLYPTADIAVLPAGADPRPYAAEYAGQLNAYELVLLAHDPDRAGENGAAMLMEHLSTRAMRWTAPDGGDWSSLTTDAPPLPTPPDVVRAGGLVFEDLAAVLAGNLEPPDTMVDDLLYVEGVHFLSGHPGSGKTTLTMHAAWLAMQDGRHVVWLDYEGGIHESARRLNDVGIPHELLVERFHYAGWPIDAPKYFGDVAAKWPGAFIVVDSASKALTLADLDENSPSEVTKWIVPIVKSSKDHRLPITIIDHVTKNASSTSRYSRGAGAKLADADVAWYVEATEPFSREKSGLIHCRRQKDRPGSLPFDLWYEVGDGKGGLILMPTHEPDAPTPGSDEPAL